MFQDSLLGQAAILKLGSYVHTKARREQVAYIYAEEDPNAFKLLAQLVDVGFQILTPTAMVNLTA